MRFSMIRALFLAVGLLIGCSALNTASADPWHHGGWRNGGWHHNWNWRHHNWHRWHHNGR